MAGSLRAPSPENLNAQHVQRRLEAESATALRDSVGRNEAGLVPAERKSKRERRISSRLEGFVTLPV